MGAAATAQDKLLCWWVSPWECRDPTSLGWEATAVGTFVPFTAQNE